MANTSRLISSKTATGTWSCSPFTGKNGPGYVGVGVAFTPQVADLCLSGHAQNARMVAVQRLTTQLLWAIIPIDAVCVAVLVPVHHDAQVELRNIEGWVCFYGEEVASFLHVYPEW